MVKHRIALATLSHPIHPSRADTVQQRSLKGRRATVSTALCRPNLMIASATTIDASRRASGGGRLVP
ncbi:hypothetical protein C8Q76DRAFT_741532 [Earliella scabrosa]|nr:hypothetical protein C8Q76DRAFT_741532 [Earliella scabrosa]